jgi:hypothetical protein
MTNYIILSSKFIILYLVVNLPNGKIIVVFSTTSLNFSFLSNSHTRLSVKEQTVALRLSQASNGKQQHDDALLFLFCTCRYACASSTKQGKQIQATKKYSDEEKQASTLLRAAHGRHVAEAWQPGFNCSSPLASERTGKSRRGLWPSGGATAGDQLAARLQMAGYRRDRR